MNEIASQNGGGGLNGSGSKSSQFNQILAYYISIFLDITTNKTTKQQSKIKNPPYIQNTFKARPIARTMGSNSSDPLVRGKTQNFHNFSARIIPYDRNFIFHKASNDRRQNRESTSITDSKTARQFNACIVMDMLKILRKTLRFKKCPGCTT